MTDTTQVAPTIGGTFYMMDRTGHKDFLRWGESKASQDAARTAFDKFKRDGYSMFVLTDEDEKGRKLESFDPGVKGFIAIPGLAGG